MKYITFNFDTRVVVDLNTFIDTLCEVHSVDISQLQSRSRKSNVMNAKSAGVYLLHQHANFPFEAIAKIFGDATHANSMHHYNNVAFRLKFNSGQRYQLNKIKGELIDGSYRNSDEESALEALVRLSVSWGKARDLNDVKAQSMKLSEEVGELMSSILKRDFDKQVDAVGDILVVLSILSDQLGFGMKDAFRSAYEAIANRQGKTINGSFIKEEDSL